MLRVVCETIDLADFVPVDQIGRNKVVGVDRSRVAYRQRRGFDRSTNGPPDIDLRETMTQSLFRFFCRQMIPQAARSGLSGIVVMYGSNILPSLFFTLLREFNVADLMVENDYLLSTSGFLEQGLNLRI